MYDHNILMILKKPNNNINSGIPDNIIYYLQAAIASENLQDVGNFLYIKRGY